MRVNIIEGAAGCAYAVERQSAAVVVDALRASATAAMLLHHGARRLLVVREVADALAAKAMLADALLYGERDGLPPAGFDFGNSPRETEHAKDRDVVFTTTTGATRLIDAWGAPVVMMATTINATAAARYLLEQPIEEITLIPAGLSSDPKFDAQEDWAAAACVANALIAHARSGNAVTWGAGEERFQYYNQDIARGELETLFATAPHAAKLRAIGMEADVNYCARLDCCRSLPVGVARHPLGVLVQDARYAVGAI